MDNTELKEDKKHIQKFVKESINQKIFDKLEKKYNKFNKSCKIIINDTV